MKNKIFGKGLVLTIVVLFLGIGVMPIVGSLSVEKQTNYESSPIVTSIKDNSGISLITLKVTGATGGDNWYGSDNSFTFTCESIEIAEIYYAIDGNWSLYTGTFNVAQGGNHTLEWYAVDHEGNQSEIDGPFYFKVDKTKPEIALEYEVVGGNRWTGWEIKLIVTAVDSMIGMHCVGFYLNDVLQETVYGSGPEYTWSLSGYRHEIYYKIYAIAFDKAGNSAIAHIYWPSCNIVILESFLNLENNYEKKSSQNFFDNVLSSENVEIKNNKFIEKSPSDISVNEVFDPASVIVVFNREFGENGWINSDVSFSIFYESDRIDEVYYQLNNGGWLLYTDPIVISEDGMYNFSWYVIDLGGYSSTPESLSFKVDLTSPQINLIKVKLAKNEFKFIAEVNDSTSGIDRVRFHSSGLVFYDYDYPYEWIWTGSSNDIVTATVYDKAGNRVSCSMKICNSIYSQQINQLLQNLILHHLMANR
jgi:hypothetical protein